MKFFDKIFKKNKDKIAIPKPNHEYKNVKMGYAKRRNSKILRKLRGLKENLFFWKKEEQKRNIELDSKLRENKVKGLSFRNKNSQKNLLRIFKSSKFKFIVLGFILITLLIIGFVAESRSANFRFNETEYSGLINLTKEQLDSIIAKDFNQKIYSINPDVLEDKLKENFIEISSVEAEKLYPNKVKFYIEEKIPYLIYIGFNGSCLVDEKGEVLKTQYSSRNIAFNAKDYNLARGFGNPNAEYVADRVAVDLPEEEIENFNFAEYDFEKKNEVLKAIEEEIVGKFTSSLQKQIDETEYNSQYNVPVVYAWDERQYKQGEFIDLKLVKFLHNSVTLTQNILQVDSDSNLWDGKFRLILSFQDSRAIFSPLREVERQVEDLELGLREYRKKIRDVEEIDLSSEHVLIKWKK